MATDVTERERRNRLGILMIDSVATCLPGSVANAASYGVPVIYLKIPGATGERILRGDPVLTPSLVEGAQELVRRGAVGVSSNCGFAATYQPAIAAAVPVPVFVSSLLQVPLVAATLPVGRKVGIVTFDAAQLSARQFRAVGWDPERIPVAVAGVRGLPAWEALAASEGEIDPEAMRKDLIRVTRELLAVEPTIGALVLECTGMCPFSPELQAAVDLPVFDLNSLIHYMLRSLRYPLYRTVVLPPPEVGISLARVHGDAPRLAQVG
jgi:hypothetical protein